MTAFGTKETDGLCFHICQVKSELIQVMIPNMFFLDTASRDLLRVAFGVNIIMLIDKYRCIRCYKY
jgi:hypothetical protein